MRDTFGFVRYIEPKKPSLREILKKILLFLQKQQGIIEAFSKKSTVLFVSFTGFLFTYAQKKVLTWSYFFERQKNRLVRFFMMKRGRYTRPFLHIAAMAVVAVGVVLTPFLAETYPVFSNEGDASSIGLIETQQQSITVDSDVFRTEVSQKPRDKVITYRVQRGDTLSTIAQKFGISTDTIKWANDRTTDNLAVDDELKILPVTGIVHKVAKGDSVYTLAVKYSTEAQAIVDFPFNDFANPQTFSLVEGQILIIPEGVKPQERPTLRRQVYIAQGPQPGEISYAGFTWPLRGVISQFAAWYHMGIDITSAFGTPIVAAQNGKVVKASAGTWDGGYGTSVMIDDGNGFQSLYAHMSGLNVSVGDEVVVGKTVIGWIGLSGRTTGPHVHFEIHKNGVLVNPMSYLQ